MSDFDDEEEVGAGLPDFLRDPLGIPRRRWPWMIFGLVLGFAATAGTVYFVVPVYKAEASVLVTSQFIPEDIVRTTVREDPFSQLNAMVGQVLSRAKLTTLIEKYDLYSEARDKRPLAEVVDSMRGNIKIAPGRSIARGRDTASQVYNITYTNLDPQVAANVTNALAALFLEAGLKTRMERAHGIADFLKKELERSQQELAEHNSQILKYTQEHRGELPDDLASNLSRLERIQSQRETISRQLSEAHARLALLTASDADPSSPASRLADLRSRLDFELSVNTPEHPNVAALQRQVEALEREVASGQGAEVNSNTSRAAQIRTTQAKIDDLDASLARLDAEGEDLDGRVRRTGLHQEHLEAMEQKRLVLRENYLQFLRKVEQAELAQTLESNQYGAQISLMDPAQPPRKPIIPRKLLVAGGIAASLGLSLLMGLLFEFLNPLIIDTEQVERLSGLPVLGSMHRIS